MQTIISALTPTSPMAWATIAAVVVGGTIGAVEAFYEYKLKRLPPWPRLL